MISENASLFESSNEFAPNFNKFQVFHSLLALACPICSHWFLPILNLHYYFLFYKCSIIINFMGSQGNKAYIFRISSSIGNFQCSIQLDRFGPEDFRQGWRVFYGSLNVKNENFSIFFSSGTIYFCNRCP